MNDDLPEKLTVYKARSSYNINEQLQKLDILKSGFGGGEGAIYFIPNNTDFCVKIFKNYREGKVGKINAFIRHLKTVCEGSMMNLYSNYSWRQFLLDYVAYPRSRIFSDQNGSKLIGYMMNYFIPEDFVCLENLLDPEFSKGNKTFLYYILYEIFFVTFYLQNIGISIGDIDGTNILVRRHRGDEGKRIIFIDVDSAQLVTEFETFANDAWHSETCAPEINSQNKNLGEKTLVFSLSVLTYKLLFGGLSPFQFLGNPGDNGEAKRNGISPLRDIKLQVPGGRSLDEIPDKLRELLKDGISPNPTLRPNLKDFLLVLNDLYH